MDMSTWFETDKTRINNPLNRETYDILLREQGEYILRETTTQDWLDTSKNSATWSNTNKSATNWSSPIKN